MLDIRLFWDSSAIIESVMRAEEPPYTQLLLLAETNALDMRVSPDVLRESEAILRRYGDDLIAKLASILDQGNFAVTLDPGREMVDYCQQLTGYRPDARILAAAEECNADILITHDHQHFVGNPLISPPDTHCRVKTSQVCLDGCLERLQNDRDVA